MSGGRTAVYAFTAQGARLGRRLCPALQAELFVPARLAAEFHSQGFEALPGLLAGTFPRFDRHVFIGAAGIAVRGVAPLLRGKTVDPAVVVLDQEGRFAVSLLGGHGGGANRLARQVAGLTGGQAVITTATDVAGLPAVDALAREKGLHMANPAAVKAVSAALLAGDPVRLHDPENWLELAGADPLAEELFEPVLFEDLARPEGPAVAATWRTFEPGPATLLLHPACLAVGIGCRRGVPAADILCFIRRTFQERGLALPSLRVLASIEAKQNEPGLLEAARELKVGMIFFSAEELNAVPAPHVSEAAMKHLGVSNVCEAAALAAAGSETLLAEKMTGRDLTLAVALDKRRDRRRS